MRFEFSKSFSRSAKQLDPKIRSEVIDAVQYFCDEFENNVISIGSGFKKLFTSS